MKHIFLGAFLTLFLLFFSPQLITAQIMFSEILGSSVYTAGASSTSTAMAFADVDGDGDDDLLITGTNGTSPWDRIAKLFLNDGNGNFTEVIGTPFQGTFQGSIDFSDIDGDNDLDVLITGTLSSNQESSILYINDGSGNFTAVAGTPFIGVSSGNVEFADIDGDNDEDLLITGITFSSLEKSKLYINDGSGNFTEVIGTPFTDVYKSSIGFADVDGDNDLDVFITGAHIISVNPSSWELISRLYINDGSGNFSLSLGNSFKRVYESSIAFADIDGDNDQDLLITGSDTLSVGHTILYTNNGNGIFTEVVGTSFSNVRNGSVSFSDVDNDNDNDLLITGSAPSSVATLYSNDSSGIFTEVNGLPFVGAYYSSVGFNDIDGDNDLDLLIVGYIPSVTPYSAKLYRNNSCFPVSSSTISPIACNNYTTPSGNHNYTTTGSFIIMDTLIGVNTCDSIITINLTLIAPDTSISIINSVLNSNANNSNYQWLDCNNNYASIPGATMQSFTPPISGSYAVEISENGCIDTSRCISVLAVGLSNGIEHNDLLIYPNPTTGNLIIDLGEVKKDIKITLTNSLGQVILTENYTSTNFINLDIVAPKGIYFLQTEIDGKVITKKIIKE
jgi:hypothetical protein